MSYDSWKTRSPDDDREPEYEPTEEDEARSHIDDLLQTASTPEEWLEICRLAKSIGDEPPIHFDHSPYEQMMMATRADWDLGMPSGMGRTEAEAIADLLEQEESK